jgi:hypothetical protein
LDDISYGIAGTQKTCLEDIPFATLIRDPIRQAVAETFMGAVCPKASMAPVVAIPGMVAGTANCESFDPVGEISKPFVTGPNPIPSFKEEVGMSTDKKPQGNRRKRKELARRLRSEDPGLEVMHPDAAGIDVGNDAHYVAVRGDRDAEPVRRFACFTADLYRMANWLRSCGVKSVAMQSTGVYWIPIYDILEEFGFQVSVVKVGPPRRCTMLSDVVAIGRSCFLTEAYAAEMEGMPTALRPIPRTKRAPASTVSTSP